MTDHNYSRSRRVTEFNLDSATKILRGRLNFPWQLGSIITTLEDLIDVPPAELLGKFIGYFTTRPNGDPCLVLIAREEPTDPISHLVVIYIHSKCKLVQKSELQPLRNKLPPPDEVKQTVINVVSDLPRGFDLSLLLQAASMLISPDLMDYYEPFKLIVVKQTSSFTCFNASIEIPKCSSSFSSENIRNFSSKLRAGGLIVDMMEFDQISSKTSSNFDILIVAYNGHLLYLINHRDINILTVFLPHINTFDGTEGADEFCERIFGVFGANTRQDKFTYIGPCRYYGDPADCCDDLRTLRAVILAFDSSPCPLHVVNASDVIEVGSKEQDFDCRSPSISRRVNPINIPAEYSQALESTHQNYDNSVYLDDKGEAIKYSVIRCDNENEGARISSCLSEVDISSQETIIVSDEDLRLQMRWLPEYIDVLRNELDSAVPPTFSVPIIDVVHRNLVLINPETLNRGLSYLSAMMEAYTSVTMLPLSQLESLNELIPVRGCPSRFIMKPVVASANYFVVIIDTQEFEYTIIGGDTRYNNRLVQDGELREVVSSLITKSVPAAKKMQLVVTKMTNYFHRFYDIVHLLMAVYQLAKIWKYAVRIPRYIIYKERDFRRYCFNICASYSLELYSYNQRMGKVSANGVLLPGAIRTSIVPLPYERSVIKGDQCPFCGKRGFKNRGRHMAAAHGGQAEFASHQRFE